MRTRIKRADSRLCIHRPSLIILHARTKGTTLWMSRIHLWTQDTITKLPLRRECSLHSMALGPPVPPLMVTKEQCKRFFDQIGCIIGAIARMGCSRSRWFQLTAKIARSSPSSISSNCESKTDSLHKVWFKVWGIHTNLWNHSWCV